MKRKGFTLIELIISLAIIGLIAVSMLPILSTGLRNIVLAGNRTEAVSLAHDNIYNDSTLVNFNISVNLPTIDEDDEETISVEGNIVTGNANIIGSNNSQVELFIYRPISY